MAATSNARSGSDVYSFKVVLLGTGYVGKTSIVLRYIRDTFTDKTTSSLNASFFKKKISVDQKRVNLDIWDTAGQEKFHALGPIYYRKANGAILVYDITDEETFKTVKNWAKELIQMLGSDICLAIVGNKTDLEDKRDVSVSDAEEFAKQVGASHFHMSAKFNLNVEDLFLTLTRRMIQHADEVNLEMTLMRSNSTRRNVVVVEDESTEPRQSSGSSCCS